MTDEHRNTVGSNTDSFHKAVFFFGFGFLVIFFLAAMVNISKCHKIEQHKEKRMQHQQNSLTLENE